MPHIISEMAIDIKGKSGGSVAEVGLHCLDVITSADAVDGICVPLRYNYDKPEKPRISRIFGYLARFFILFQTEKSSREVVIS